MYHQIGNCVHGTILRGFCYPNNYCISLRYLKYLGLIRILRNILIRLG